jgi:uncharacterized protein YjbI with pentapeptide repeats
VLSRADLSGASLAMADMTLIYAREVNLTGATLRGAQLQRALLIGADMQAVIAGPQAIVGHGDWPTNFSRARMLTAKLAEADLRRAMLHRADLGGADLRGADLSDAVLREAVLLGANLHATRLDGADLDGCTGFVAGAGAAA